MDNSGNIVQELTSRLEKYSNQLKAAENEGNASKSRRYKRIVDQYLECIKDVKFGRIVQLEDLPNPPGFPPLIAAPADSNLETPEDPAPMASPLPSPMVERKPMPPPTMIVDEVPEEESLLDKLNIRLEKYQSVLQAAEGEGASAKVRRYQRIIKQYNEAIKNAQKGVAIELGELPNPPGLPPLVPPSSPTPSPLPSPVPSRSHSPEPDQKPVAAPTRPAPSPPSRPISRADKQTALLRDRQKEYRDAAINAKKAGQIPEAKEFLKICKGFDRLIGASESGLPVDLTTIPVSLHAADQAEEALSLVTNQDFSGKNDSDVFQMIKTELVEQIKSCMTRKSQLKSIGDVANANRFEQWALTFKKDLNKVTVFQSGGQPVPKFHYEQKSFPIVQCFSDVSAGDVELSIVQAVGLPKVVDSYVGYEFPYPSESPPSGYTAVIKNADDPKFDFTINFPIDRDNKQCQRLFKRQGQSGIKLELWARGGFLRKDISMGTVVVKLLPLTTDIMIHDAYDLMNGRRPAGGKLEVKIRVREPILAKKIETITEKWLVLD